MRVWSEQALPRFMDLVLDTPATRDLRRRVVESASGDVVELGYGSGTNLPRYPAAVDSVLAVEPSAVARRLAARREQISPIPVRHVGLDGASLPLPDHSVDTVVSTFTLCTIGDLDAALSEVARVLRPDGQFLFLEHGLAEHPKVQRWQRRLTGIQQRVFAGCHLERAIDDRIRRAGFTLTALSKERVTVLWPLAPLYLGCARLQ